MNSNTHQHAVPPEVWTAVAEFTRRSDLLSLASTSSFYLSISRLVLYRHLKLSMDETGWGGEDYSMTFDLLLAHDGKLAKMVKTLDLCGRTDDRAKRNKDGARREIIPLSVLKAMANLHTLIIREYPPFPTVSGRQDIVKALRVHCPNLKQYEYYPGWGYLKAWNMTWEIEGLERLRWCEQVCE